MRTMNQARRAVGWLAAIGLLPLLSVLVSSLFAGLFGCELSEVGPQVCSVLGLDVGGVLATLFTLGWMALITLPLTGLLLMTWALFEGFVYLRRRRRARKSGDVEA